MTPGGNLLKDDRGVMMLAGVFFCFVWIGLVWFILGIGTAIHYHENLQMDADAAAFAAAVYDARGMNILAMINVIMGVALSALIIAHILQLAAFASLLVGDCLSCMGSFFCGYGAFSCPGDCSAMKGVNGGVSTVDAAVHDILRVCHLVEVGIAVGWPWVAAGKSTTSVPHTPLVPLTTSFSYSQVPSSNNIAAATFHALNLVNPSDPNPNRYGLPVTSDEYKHLCTVAIMDVTSLYGLVPGAVTKLIGPIIDKFGNWLCDAGDESTVPTDFMEYLLPSPSPPLTPASWCGICAGWTLDPGYCPLSKFTTLPGDMRDVKDHSQSPMKLINTKMGTDYFGVWSTAIGDYQEGRTPNRVRIAGLFAKGITIVPPLAEDVDMGVARSEFYYDPKPGDSVAAETTISTHFPPVHGAIPNCMWNMRWRARLRRYHNFPGLGGPAESLTVALNNVGGAFAGRAFSRLLGGGSVVGLDTAVTKVDVENNKPAVGIYH